MAEQPCLRLSFSLGAAQREMEMLDVFRQQFGPVLAPFVEMIREGEED